ncbi:MAG: hypothetical protein WA653_00285 [Candidatus Sulfotelmatobacter sp.]
MNIHEQYEELCALAASGQASQDELADLRSHLETCPSCRSATYDFTQISAQALSQLAAKRLHCLAAARSEMKFMSATIEEQRAEIESERKARDDLNSRLTAAEKGSAVNESERAQLDARIAQLETEMEKAKSEKNASDTALALEDTELRELRKKVSDQGTALAEQQELAEKGSDVRDLVVARNLHIIDVHDRDGNGKSQRAFGRIFYTEGKSLIFYAYDLVDPRKLDAKVSFYVWGERLGAEKPIRSLGIFHDDDARDGRWVLTFDDPQVLAQINSVFVTVESSKKAIKEPGGRRVLFAFLGDKPNHP